MKANAAGLPCCDSFGVVGLLLGMVVTVYLNCYLCKLLATKIAKMGENISIARFVRFKVGETMAATADESTEQQG